AFACEAAFSVQILINVRDRAGIDVEADFSGVQGSETRARCRMDADADARLKDSVAGGDDAADGVDDGAVERVGHGADHRGGRSAGQLRVGVESDDVLHAGKDGDVAGLDGEGVEFAAE